MISRPRDPAALDSRVTDDDGRPAIACRLYRGWFRIRRAAGPAGVVLEARIPGCPESDTSHKDQAAATMAAAGIYAAYCDAVRALTSSDRSEDQEN
jgi:hypothetical protein